MSYGGNNSTARPNAGQVIAGYLDQATTAVQDRRLYGKFRAYLFCNFGGIAIVALALTLRFLFSDEPDNLEVAGGMAILTIFPALITWLIWRSVAKKVSPEQRLPVFWGFFSTGIFVLGKVLLCFTIILIPLALRIAGHNPYEWRRTSSGATILVRRKLNGQYEEVEGNIYEDSPF